MKIKSSNIGFGVLLLLVATLVLASQFTSFANFGIVSIIATILALAFTVQCVASLRFSPLPIPLAVLYIVFQTPLGLPAIRVWPLILVAVLAYAGLDIIIPRKRRHQHHKDANKHIRDQESDGNNPSCSVIFGSVKHRLRADALETVHIHCSFGAMKVIFEQAEPCTSGAVAVINCSFGAVKLLVPKHWQIIDRVNCSLGGVDIGKGFASPSENGPKLTLSGDVSFGGIEVKGV